MTRLPGTVVWSPPARGIDAYLHALAAVLPTMHATPVPEDPAIPVYRPYERRLRRPPAWSARPALWRRAFAVLEDPPRPERRLVHRDHHPGNILWTGGEVSGVVDWASTALGSPAVDVGHCRMNLNRVLGPAAADRFAAHHRALTGRPHEPFYDIAAVIGGFEEHEVHPADEALLAAAFSSG